MPVSTRSQDDHKTRPRTITTSNVEDTTSRNPHHGMKEKMKALTLLYEQQKQVSLALKNPSFRSEDRRLSTVGQERENAPASVPPPVPVPALPVNCNITRTFVYDDTKENNLVLNEKIVGLTRPRKTEKVVRKLSLGGGFGGVQSEARGFTKGRNVGLKSELERSDDAGESRILVFVRLRPLSKKEKEAGARSSVKIVNMREVYLTEFASENDYLRLKRLRGRHFAFDASFPDSTTQQEVYSTTTSELVEAVLQGRNGSVFCYGATGAGKTYTMLGTLENPGVMVLAIKDLFTKIRQRSYDGDHVVQLSYLEVYNETVRDLLSPGRPLVLREDKQGIVAAGLTQYRAYSTDEVMALLQQGNRNRTTEPTRANETSSRSHAILQVVVEYRVKNDESMNIFNRVGKLSLIDLAGSERALATDQRTLRSLEGANINRSLLALSSCINALVEGKKHIPYRNSKLTQLLKDSLGGACNTVMIANISPSNLSFSETQNTLHWADRAKEICTKACDANEEPVEVPESETDQAKLILELQKENRELRMQLARQQQKLITLQAQTLAANAPETPSSATSFLSPPRSSRPSEKHKPRPSILPSNCVTPEIKRKAAADEAIVRDLRKTIKELEAEMVKMKKDHMMQLKQKDEFIREISRKHGRPSSDGVGGGEGAKPSGRVVTRASLRPPKEPSVGDLKSPGHRFVSPTPTAKKRTFWDITTANSPSVATLNSRKTRSHVAKEQLAAPSSMLLQGRSSREFYNARNSSLGLKNITDLSPL